MATATKTSCPEAAPYNEVLRRLGNLGRADAALSFYETLATRDAATAEQLNRALVRSVARGPTADAMARLPPPAAPEVVLLGRSNVGKSSLANALLGRRALAPASPVPGRTRRFCFYDVNEPGHRPHFRLVDVPGAGFAVDDVQAALDGDLQRGMAEGKADSWRGLVHRCWPGCESKRAAARRRRIFRGDESRRRRGCDVDSPWRRVAATPRPRRG